MNNQQLILSLLNDAVNENQPNIELYSKLFPSLSTEDLLKAFDDYNFDSLFKKLETSALGLHIIVIESGYVYLGVPTPHECPILGKCVKIKDAENIRRWGTDKGLGQLAHIGKQKNTVLDYTGTITVPISKILHFIEVTSQAVGTYGR